MTREELKNIIKECIVEIGTENTILTINESILEILHEDEIYSGNDYSIHMDGMVSANVGYCKDPYIKIIDGPSWIKSSNCLLFYLKDCTVGYHNERGKGDLRWKQEIGKFLNIILPSINPKNGKTYIETLNEAILKRYKNEVSDINLIYQEKLKDYTNFGGYRKPPTKKER